ncbi:hypothetical protein BCR36DRAFT_416928 [Piromyces finnis]|uniref:C2H2-type domain-containing protein n=1 Tax=Piromyces finnis TaxID=1754191 RepID=A0A1Y1UQZ1_9FUNG|nr:hypothetical protein BCR36DRAFT_416928 [Piromyces finnis]|eukprot:ORX40372.1 hypothetical protein BCR36DRAFT_416928 [Piromyces finnis]
MVYNNSSSSNHAMPNNINTKSIYQNNNCNISTVYRNSYVSSTNSTSYIPLTPGNNNSQLFINYNSIPANTYSSEYSINPIQNMNSSISLQQNYSSKQYMNIDNNLKQIIINNSNNIYQTPINNHMANTASTQIDALSSYNNNIIINNKNIINHTLVAVVNSPINTTIINKNIINTLNTIPNNVNITRNNSNNVKNNSSVINTNTVPVKTTSINNNNITLNTVENRVNAINNTIPIPINIQPNNNTIINATTIKTLENTAGISPSLAKTSLITTTTVCSIPSPNTKQSINSNSVINNNSINVLNSQIKNTISPSNLKYLADNKMNNDNKVQNISNSIIGPNISMVNRPKDYCIKSKIHICECCGKIFNKASRLRDHMLTHVKTRAFQCETCHLPFKRKNDMIRHMRIHTGYKPYKCKKCGKGFTRSDALSRHIKSGLCQLISINEQNQSENSSTKKKELDKNLKYR